MIRNRREASGFGRIAILFAIVLATAAALTACSERGRASKESEAAAERLFAEIREFRDSAGRIAPELAAKRWFELFDRVNAHESPAHGVAMFQIDPATTLPVGISSMLASLPPPAAWPAMHAQATERALSKTNRGTLAVRYLTELLVSDRAAARATLDSLNLHANDLPAMERDSTREAISQARRVLTRIYGSPAERVAAFEQEMLAPAEYQDVVVPDVVAIVGMDSARKILAGVAASPALVTVEGGRETRELVREIATANIGTMRIPQWKLVDGIEAAPLFELIAKRFPRGKESSGEEDFSRMMKEWAYREAALYHFLAMVKEGRQADAERTLRTLGGDDEIQVPHVATEALRRAGLSEPLYRFLHAQLEKQPTLRAWSVYIEQAAFTGHSADALALIERLLARKDSAPTVLAELQVRRIAALLAADRIDQASTAYKSLLAAAPDDDEPDAAIRMKVALDAAAVGRLTDRKDLSSIGLDFARRSFRVLNGKKSTSGCAHLEALAGELRRQKLVAEALAFANECVERQPPAANHYDAMMRAGRPGGQAAVIELFSIYLEMGRTADAIALLETSTHWGARDLATLLALKDSLGQPLGASVARALATAGREEDGLRVARATVAVLPGSDSAYEVIAAHDPKAADEFEALYALDPYEERPLIWKAATQLAAGSAKDAESTARRAIAIDPSDGEEGPNDRMRAYSVLSEALARQDLRKDATLFANAVAAIRISERADQLYYAGLYERAFAGYRAALEKFSDAYCIQSRLAVQLSKQGRRDEALVHYRRAYELMPTSFGRVESHCFGCENVFQGEEAQSIAEQVFSDIIRRSPNQAQAHYLLAYLREQQGNPAGALRPLRAAVGADGLYLNAWKRLHDLGGKIYIDADERDIARLKLLELDPMKRHSHYDLNEVGALVALWNGAARALETSTKAAPPKAVYALPKSASGREGELASMPDEIREQMRELYETFETERMSGGASPPNVVMYEHALTAGTLRLMRGTPREEID